MVRCGVVSHPREWGRVGLHEIMGTRRRHRLVDLDRLCWRVQASTLEDFRGNLAVGLEEAIARGELKRLPYWTESIAVACRIQHGAFEDLAEGGALADVCGGCCLAWRNLPQL